MPMLEKIKIDLDKGRSYDILIGYENLDRLGKYAGSLPEIYTIQDPVRLGWEPLVKIEHYHVGAEKILGVKS